jgi:hypothetical protein
MKIGKVEVFLKEFNTWIPTELSTVFINTNSQENE